MYICCILCASLNQAPGLNFTLEHLSQKLFVGLKLIQIYVLIFCISNLLYSIKSIIAIVLLRCFLKLIFQCSMMYLVIKNVENLFSSFVDNFLSNQGDN